MNRIAMVVDRDEASLRSVTYSLAKGDFTVTPLTKGTELMHFLSQGCPDIVLLSRLLPDLDGLELCGLIKDQFPDLPVLMLSSTGDAKEGIESLKVGADDFLGKPFSAAMLMAKVEALCRRFQGFPQRKTSRFRLGAMSFDERKHQVLLEDKPLKLTKTEYKLLLFLARHAGVVVSKKDILGKIMGYAEGANSMESNVAFHINALRKKLGDFRHYIETVRGFGYRFLHPEEEASTPGAAGNDRTRNAVE